MIDILLAKRFIDNDFEEAIIYTNYKKDKLNFNLKLKGEPKSYPTIACYSDDNFKCQQSILANFLVDTFLNNNSIYKVGYYQTIPHHKDKVGIFIQSNDKKLSLAISSKASNINNVFPNLVRKIEYYKQISILKYIENNDIKNFKIIDNNRYLTGIVRLNNYLCYLPLILGHNDFHKGELEFLKMILNHLFLNEDSNILNGIETDNFKPFTLETSFKFKVDNVEQLKLLKSVLEELKEDNLQKQLVMEGYNAYNGKIS